MDLVGNDNIETCQMISFLVNVDVIMTLDTAVKHVAPSLSWIYHKSRKKRIAGRMARKLIRIC